jgi:uncharacterized protein (TIGR03067 family)
LAAADYSLAMPASTMKRFLPVIATSFALLAFAQEKDAPKKPEKGAVAANEKAGDATADSQKPQGVWKPIAAVLGGIQLPPAELNAITLKMAGDNYEVTVAGENVTDKGTCTLDPTTNPKRMTIKGTDGPNRGKTILAIYEMKDAGSLRVCYDLSGTDFPKEFKAPKGTQFYLVGYRRPK